MRVLSQKDFFDTLTFNKTFIENTNEILDVFDKISGRRLFEKDFAKIKAKTLDETKDLPEWFIDSKFSIFEWIVAIFETRLCRFFLLKEIDDSFIRTSKLTLLKYKNYWEGLTSQARFVLIDQTIEHFRDYHKNTFLDNSFELSDLKILDSYRNIPQSNKMFKLILNINRIESGHKEEFLTDLKNKLISLTDCSSFGDLFGKFLELEFQELLKIEHFAIGRLIQIIQTNIYHQDIFNEIECQSQKMSKKSQKSKKCKKKSPSSQKSKKCKKKSPSNPKSKLVKTTFNNYSLNDSYCQNSLEVTKGKSLKDEKIVQWDGAIEKDLLKNKNDNQIKITLNNQKINQSEISSKNQPTCDNFLFFPEKLIKNDEFELFPKNNNQKNDKLEIFPKSQKCNKKNKTSSKNQNNDQIEDFSKNPLTYEHFSSQNQSSIQKPIDPLIEKSSKKIFPKQDIEIQILVEELMKKSPSIQIPLQNDPINILDYKPFQNNFFKKTLELNDKKTISLYNENITEPISEKKRTSSTNSQRKAAIVFEDGFKYQEVYSLSYGQTNSTKEESRIFKKNSIIPKAVDDYIEGKKIYSEDEEDYEFDQTEILKKNNSSEKVEEFQRNKSSEPKQNPYYLKNQETKNVVITNTTQKQSAKIFQDFKFFAEKEGNLGETQKDLFDANRIKHPVIFGGIPLKNEFRCGPQKEYDLFQNLKNNKKAFGVNPERFPFDLQSNFSQRECKNNINRFQTDKASKKVYGNLANVCTISKWTDPESNFDQEHNLEQDKKVEIKINTDESAIIDKNTLPFETEKLKAIENINLFDNHIFKPNEEGIRRNTIDIVQESIKSQNIQKEKDISKNIVLKNKNSSKFFDVRKYSNTSLNVHKIVVDELDNQHIVLSNEELTKNDTFSSNSYWNQPVSIKSNPSAKTFSQKFRLMKMIDIGLENIFQNCILNTFSSINENIKNLKADFSTLKQNIDFIVRNEFIEKGFYCMEFGSFATNLLTPFSDLDLGVMVDQVISRDIAIDILRSIEKVLKDKKWVKSINPIYTANVPVLKLICQNENQNVNFSSDLRVDIIVIAIEEKKLKGHAIRTTEFLQKCLKSYPSMRDFNLFMKFVLNKLGLTNSYQGYVIRRTLLFRVEFNHC